MFKSEASSLKKSASAWWSHMRYILVAALAVSFALHHVAAAAEAKCSRGLDVDAPGRARRVRGDAEVAPVLRPQLRRH
jgi:hypothetical protein